MSRVSKYRRRRSATRGRWLLFIAGGIATAALLIVILVSLENESPVQSAPQQSSPAAKSAGPTSASTTPAPAPETFTFYDTLEKQHPPSPGLTEKKAIPAVRPPSSEGSSSGKIVIVPKKSVPGYTIQVAAVKDRAAAKAMTDRLKRKGYLVFALPYEVPRKGTWYRVRVGHFSNREAAEEVANRLAKEERLTPYIAKE